MLRTTTTMKKRCNCKDEIRILVYEQNSIYLKISCSLKDERKVGGKRILMNKWILNGVNCGSNLYPFLCVNLILAYHFPIHFANKLRSPLYSLRQNETRKVSNLKGEQKKERKNSKPWNGKTYGIDYSQPFFRGTTAE